MGRMGLAYAERRAGRGASTQPGGIIRLYHRFRGGNGPFSQVAGRHTGVMHLVVKASTLAWAMNATRSAAPESDGPGRTELV